MKILAFAASTSRQSINRKLIGYATQLIADLVPGAKISELDLLDYEMPIYSIDRQNEGGIPEQAHSFFRKIGEADALLISFAEHNGFYTAAYKNTFDWASRIQMRVFQDKPTVMLSTSVGKNGGANVLKAATDSAPYFGNKLLGSLSVPSFNTNFDLERGGLTDAALDAELRAALSTFELEGKDDE